MNFLNPLVKFRIIFLFLPFFLYCNEAFSLPDLKIKGNPIIHAFKSDLINKPTHNSSLIIDKNGILYLGQIDQISIYNGSSWSYISSKGKNILCLTDHNSVYFSGYENLGYLAPDSLKRMAVVSIKDKLPVKYKTFKSIRNIESLDDAVFFQIDNSLLVFNSGEFKVLQENVPDAGLYKIEGKIIYTDKGGKFYVYAGDVKPEEYNTGIKNICSIISAKDFTFILDSGNFLYKTDRSFNILSKIQLSFIKNVRFGINLNDEELFLSDSNNTFYIIKQDGKLLEKWDNLPEIPMSLILDIFHDPGQGIWILQEKSINLLEYPVALKRVFSSPKDSGIIHDIKFIDSNLYYTSTRGVYSFDFNKDNKTRLLLQGFYYRLIPVVKGLCAVSTDKIYFINNKKTELIFRGEIYDFSYSSDYDLLFISSPAGITACKVSEGETKTLNVFRTLVTPHKIIVHENFLWYTDFENLYTGNINVANDWNERKINLLGNKRIIDLFIWDNKLNLVHSDIILTLTADSICYEENFLTDFYHVVIFSSGDDDPRGTLILLTTDHNKNQVLYYGNKLSKTLNSIRLPLSVDLFSPSLEYPGNSDLILSSEFDIYTLDISSLISDKHIPKTIITGIYAQDDTIFDGLSYSILNQQIDKKLQNIPYKNRLLKISLSSSNYFARYNHYYYTLKKNEKYCSDRINDPIILLNNLDAGEYELQVYSENYNGNPGSVTTLAFSILPPIYKSKLAVVIYSLIAAILAFIFYKSYKFSRLRTHEVSVSIDNDHQPVVTESIHDFQPDVSSKNNLHLNIETDKGKDHARWDKYEMVTVLFSDIQGFTKIAESTNPEVLIDELDRFFFHFDSVVEKYNIEKIKTIGDAYMAAGGIPKKNNCNPVEAVLAALEMQLYMKQLKNTKVDIWDLRIGIHTGPVIAGEVGHKKRSYDIWGDTVNTASRMESSGEPGKINISGVTHNFVKDFFICEYRGKLPVKYKGNIDMYFVKGLRPELSVNLAGIPNRRLYFKLQMLRLLDLEEVIFTKFETELPQNLYFHNIEYIRHQYEYAHLISKAENLDGEETLLILTSTLLMNVGFIYNYENQEIKSAEYSRSLLPEFKYTEKQITSVSNLILATKWPTEPRTITEKVLYDIKMEYLGCSDFLKLYKLLFLEQNEYLFVMNIDEFKRQQIQILHNHKFSTSTADRLREVSGEEQIKRITDDDWH